MLNQVQIIGTVGRDPEVRQAGNSRVANLSVATSEKWTDKSTGDRKEKTEWHRVTVWGALADIVEKYVRKGDKIFLQGKLQTRKWTDKDGVEKYTTEIVLQGFDAKLTMLGGKQAVEPTETEQKDIDDEIPF